MKTIKSTTLMKSPHDGKIMVLRRYSKRTNPSLDVYDLQSKKVICNIPKLDPIDRLCWLDSPTFLTVSAGETLEIRLVKSGERKTSLITDFGSINCMKYDYRTRLLVTGTDYGYVGVYRIGQDIQPLGKMVKVNNRITTLDMTVKEREQCDRPMKSLQKTVANATKDDDESDDESDNDEEELDAGDGFEITIFGGSSNEIVVWDYQRKTITDTIRVGNESCHVTSLLALPGGCLFAGDSRGTINVFDQSTLTCRQTFEVLKVPVNCLAADERGQTVLASSHDSPLIVQLKRRADDSQDYMLFESIKSTSHVLDLEFVNKKEFLAASDDGSLIHFQRHGKSLKRALIVC